VGEGGFASAKPGEGSLSADADLSLDAISSADRTPHPALARHLLPQGEKGSGQVQANKNAGP
ncbi:hypothetical protein, partial [Listeria monocytogenes]|uniref:hypothetical protein n=1 Tax=Listeria monocytogenes TaxID=1639 RepID=UPI003F665C5B